jgi:hypothetical protein
MHASQCQANACALQSQSTRYCHSTSMHAICQSRRQHVASFAAPTPPECYTCAGSGACWYMAWLVPHAGADAGCGSGAGAACSLPPPNMLPAAPVIAWPCWLPRDTATRSHCAANTNGRLLGPRTITTRMFLSRRLSFSATGTVHTIVWPIATPAAVDATLAIKPGPWDAAGCIMVGCCPAEQHNCM